VGSGTPSDDQIEADYVEARRFVKPLFRRFPGRKRLFVNHKGRISGLAHNLSRCPRILQSNGSPKVQETRLQWRGCDYVVDAKIAIRGDHSIYMRGDGLGARGPTEVRELELVAIVAAPHATFDAVNVELRAT